MSHDIIGLVALLGFPGALLLGIALIQLRRIEGARHWPTVPGRVVASGIVRMPGMAGSTARAFRPRVEFEYEVGGQTLRARQIRLDQQVGGSKAYAERRAATHPVGSAVTVFYNPRDPAEAALDIRPHAVVWVLAAAGTLLLATCAVLLAQAL